MTPEIAAATLAGLTTTPVTLALLTRLPEADTREVLARALAGGLAPCCPHPLSGWDGWVCELTEPLELSLWQHACTLPPFAPLRVEIETALIWGQQ